VSNVSAEDLTIKYPIWIEIKVPMEKDGQVAVATVGGPVGRVPTHDEILQVLADAQAYGVQHGFSLFESPKKFMAYTAEDRLGIRVAIPVDEKEFCYKLSDLPAPRQKSDEECDLEEDDDE